MDPWNFYPKSTKNRRFEPASPESSEISSDSVDNEPRAGTSAADLFRRPMLDLKFMTDLFTKQRKGKVNKRSTKKKVSKVQKRKLLKKKSVGSSLKKKSKSPRASGSKSSLRKTTTSSDVTRYVPKYELFICAECDVHFVFGDKAAACRHGQVDKAPCSQCNRIFRKADLPLHAFQHKQTRFLDVIRVFKDFTEILYQCEDCNCHMIQPSTLHAHMPNCDPTASIKCPQCDISLHLAGTDVSKHLESHKGSSTPRVVRCTRFTDHSDDAIKFYHCGHCNCVLNRKNEKHLSGSCFSDRNYKICEYCGLQTTAGSAEQHKSLHAAQNVTLYDFVFYNMQTDAEIPPPMPSFPRCGSCEVYFVSELQMSQHRCGQVKSTTCDECDKTFEVRCMLLHRVFHEVAAARRT